MNERGRWYTRTYVNDAGEDVRAWQRVARNSEPTPGYVPAPDGHPTMGELHGNAAGATANTPVPTASARTERRTPMHKDAAAYFAAKQALNERLMGLRAEIGAKYMVPVYADVYADPWRAKRREADREMEQAKADIYREMDDAYAVLKGSSNTVIKWMAENIGRRDGYEGHVEAVLQGLPEGTDTPTYDDVEPIGRRGGWCEEWDTFLQRAVDAGLFTGTVPPKALAELYGYLRGQVNSQLYDRTRNKLRRLIDAAVAEAEANAKAEILAATAVTVDA